MSKKRKKAGTSKKPSQPATAAESEAAEATGESAESEPEVAEATGESAESEPEAAEASASAVEEPAPRKSEPAAAPFAPKGPEAPPANPLAAIGWAFAVLLLGVVILAALSGLDSLLE